jgi:hypothetical protein
MCQLLTNDHKKVGIMVANIIKDLVRLDGWVFCVLANFCQMKVWAYRLEREFLLKKIKLMYFNKLLSGNLLQCFQEYCNIEFFEILTGREKYEIGFSRRIFGDHKLSLGAFSS